MSSFCVPFYLKEKGFRFEIFVEVCLFLVPQTENKCPAIVAN